MKHVKLTLDNEHLEGILVKEDDKHLVLKLSSGYNIGIKKSRIIKIEDVKDHSGLVKEQHAEKVHNGIHNGNDGTHLPKVLILHTGGTIASKVDYKTGAVVPTFTPDDLNRMFPELKELARIESVLFRNMFSEDMRFSHYNLIAKEIAKQLSFHKDLKGIIITHGTDTMHYTGAALSFVFENLPIPVVLVGSQRSSDRGSADSAMNLISAIAFIANTTMAGVFICMHESMSDDNCIILGGINARKMHSSRRDAFRPINRFPIARVDYATKTIDYISQDSNASGSLGALKLHLFDEKLKVGILIGHPNMYVEEIKAFDGFDGLVLEGMGLGQFPINEIDEHTTENTKIRHALSEIAKKMPVVMSLQTIYGAVNMNVYQTGRDMQELGIIGNHSSMTPETSFIKLAWLLSQKLDPKEYFMKDFRSEMQFRE